MTIRATIENMVTLVVFAAIVLGAPGQYKMLSVLVLFNLNTPAKNDP